MLSKKEIEKAINKHPNVVAREIPNSAEAERAMIGGLLIDARAAAKYIPELSEDDFYTPAHKAIFEGIRALFASARPTDLVTVANELDRSGTLALCGGVEYLAKTVDSTPTVANLDYYHDELKKHARLRALIDISNRTARAAYAFDPGEDALSTAEAELYSLTEKTGRGKPELVGGFVKTVLADLKERARNPNIYRGIPTGFTKLDMMLGGGFQRSDLIILAARPGQGKTSFAMNCAVNAALRNKPDGQPYSVAVFTIEMSRVQLARRIMCSLSEYDMSRSNRALVSADEWDRLFAADARLQNVKLFLDETSAITPAEVLSKCRAIKHSAGLDFVMIDYLQLMKSGYNLDNFVREIASITRDLKLAAKELDVPILLLSQMSRGIEQRKGPDREARLSDLRDSGAIEQDADVVLFIDRKEPNSEEKKSKEYSRPAAEEVYLNVAKHRNGETGGVKLIWHSATVTFTDENSKLEPPPGNTGVDRSSGFEESAPPPEPEEELPFDPDEEPPAGDYVSPDDSGLA